MDEEDLNVNEVYENFNVMKTGLMKTNGNTSIKCMHVNVRSCRKNWDNLLLDLDNCSFKFDVIALTEINLKDDEIVNYNLKNYDKYHNCRKNQRGGGILLFIRKKNFHAR